MEYELKAGSQGHIYLHKRIREAFGDELIFYPDDAAAAIYPKDADLLEVINSLKLIIQHLSIRTKRKEV